MVRLGLILGFFYLIFMVFTFIDCVRTEPTRVRALPKVVWAVLIVVLPLFGGILWYLLGKERALQRPARSTGRGPLAPDDDPAFLRRLGEDKEREARIREIEAQLAELDDDKNNPKD